MKRTVHKGLLRGREIVRLLPEDEDDVRELKRLDAAGLLDANESFADFHENKAAKATKDETS